mmetsp:Transcript_9867/g.24784  ORF Transcript_9867/g.24784 Transcript_9867/m.24784 type:complete len:113 (+) Transcript_9867:2-340(+)
MKALDAGQIDAILVDKLVSCVTWVRLPGPPVEKVYSINCHDLDSLIKSISQHQQLRSLVVVQQLYDGTTLTFAPHHVRVVSACLRQAVQKACTAVPLRAQHAYTHKCPLLLH